MLARDLPDTFEEMLRLMPEYVGPATRHSRSSWDELYQAQRCRR